jgi:hypothetical protein
MKRPLRLGKHLKMGGGIASELPMSQTWRAGANDHSEESI